MIVQKIQKNHPKTSWENPALIPYSMEIQQNLLIVRCVKDSSTSISGRIQSTLPLSSWETYR
ncbi:hypothetical protein [Bacteroidetes bacterium endosymbiont of Geopemphigus sp.]|uniref:hypothetical protein n=1 Tax=Bacteroidetes bacterium endosymbiont of Geopemphigus sp. TaxID=2047937 RepID=UPI0011AF3602|nr:hypothetical protein [Bacteroidetes bacterium endosymbiont of Geopemphigus sp.]